MPWHRGVARSRLWVVMLSLCAVLAGCSMNSAGSPQDSRAATSGPPVTKVLTFIEENHSLAQMQTEMPYLDRLAHQYAYATNYSAITHPSLPNYLAIAGGATFGVTDDAGPSVNAANVGDAVSVFDQAVASGHTAKTYAESMPANCATHESGLYAVKHNPWTYFPRGRGHCERFDVPSGTPSSGALATDIARGTLPNVGMVIPNLCNDAHNDGCSLGTADDWLKGWLPQILRSDDFTTGRLVVVITADEDDRRSGNKVLTVVLHADQPHHKVVATPLTHYSLSAYYSYVIGASPLADAATSPDIGHAFGL
jgi:phosphatidylinositol-3-phosphatase